MFEAKTLQLLEGGITADYFDGLTESSLDEHLQTLKASRACIDAVEANVLVALNRVQKQTSPSARHSDGADNLTERTGVSRGEARKKTRRAQLIDHHPSVASALALGQITAGHADALSAIPTKHADALEAELDELLARASSQSEDEFSDTIRRWKQRQSARNGENYHKSLRDQRTHSMRRDRHSGMTRVSGLLDPESAAIAKSLVSEIDQQLLREDQKAAAEDPDFVMRTAGQRMADALVEICRRARHAAAATSPKAEPTVVVTIPLADLVSGANDGEAFGGGPVSAETARKLACEGGIIPAVLGSNGQVLDLGRRTRLATASQRLALHTRYRGCAVPGCDAPFEWCHMHHLDHWEAGGPTDLSNLIPVCTRHHSQIHDGRLTITRDHADADQWSRPKDSGSRDHRNRRKRCAEARPQRTTENPESDSRARSGRQQTLAV